MAWFKNEDGLAPTPVTADRILDIVKNQLKFNGNDEDKGKFYCYVNGVPVRFDAGPLEFAYYINATLFEQTVPKERYEEVLAWVTNFNVNTHFITAYVIGVDGDGPLTVCADAPVVVEAGMTDEQLKNSLEHALTGLILFANRFCEDFGFKLPDSEE